MALTPNLRRSTKPMIGLLGAPGSGKSLVATQLASLGCGVIDADKLAKQELARSSVEQQLVQWWGTGLLDGQGGLCTDAIASIVFDDPRQLRRLEELIHPLVHAQRVKMHRQLQADPDVLAIVEDMPLLLEKGFAEACDVLLFVDAPRQIRMQRLRRSRGWSEQDLGSREKNQLALDTKRSRADHTIDNSDGQAETLRQVERLLSQILLQRI